MDKAKESFDTEIGSEASIKGLNSICIFFGEEGLGARDICFGEETRTPAALVLARKRHCPCFNNRG